MIDEDESIFYFAFWVLGFLIVNAYGLVILIIWLIRKIRNRKKQ
jgi:predicted outer membrane lipoprotein